MLSTIATAVLGTALFSQLSSAATLGHSHGRLHSHEKLRRTPEPSVVGSVVDFLTEADEALITGLGMLTGKNVGNSSSSTSAVTVGAYGGDYVVEFNNNSDEDIVVVVWDGASSWVNAVTPAVTHSLAANRTMHVSFDPALNGGSISGAWAGVYSDTTLVNGQVSNTWGEYTFAGEWSTTDISREVNMAGNTMTMDNYATKADAKSGAEAACSANMEKCAFVCTNGANTCGSGGDYEIIGCSAGTADTTTDASGTNGGCAGIADGGWVVVNFS